MSTETYERAVGVAKQVLAGVSAEQLDQPTPCATWDVRALINHIVGGSYWFAAATEAGQAPAGDELPDFASGDFVASYEDGSSKAAAAFGAPGAMEKTVKLPFGEYPGAGFMGLATIDTFTHSWDLAKATGQPADLDPELAAQLLEQSKTANSDAVRGPSRCRSGHSRTPAPVRPPPTSWRRTSAGPWRSPTVRLLGQAVTAPSPPSTFGAQQRWADGDLHASCSSRSSKGPPRSTRMRVRRSAVRWSRRSTPSPRSSDAEKHSSRSRFVGRTGSRSTSRICSSCSPDRDRVRSGRTHDVYRDSRRAALGGRRRRRLLVAALGLTTATMWLLRRLTNVRAPRVPAFALTGAGLHRVGDHRGRFAGAVVAGGGGAERLVGNGVAVRVVSRSSPQTLHVARVVARHQTIRKVPAAETIAVILLALDEARRAPDRPVVQAAPPAPGFVVVAPNGETMGDVDAFAALVQQLEDTIERALPARLATTR